MLFLHREVHTYYDFGTPDDREWLVDEIIAHKWEQNELMFQLQWNVGDTTWEAYDACKDLQALGDYLRLIRVKDLQDLSCQGITMLN
jgi:hypothetical protein